MIISLPSFTKRAKRAIARNLEQVLNELGISGDLQFAGSPVREEARESIKTAMKLGPKAAKVKNKERFTPKKYRKE